jgi:hypothetical protein
VYTSFLFRVPPIRDYGTVSDSDVDLNNFINDCDYEGRHLDTFMKEVSTWNSVFGHSWIIVSKGNVGARTQADEIALGARPYLSLLTPLTVLDWEWVRSPSGEYTLGYLRYIEDVNGNIQTVKEWTDNVITTNTVDTGNLEISSIITEPNPLGCIPAVVSYNKKGLVRGIGLSDITDIADLQRFIYNATSEVEQSIRLNTHPSLVKTTGTSAGAGSGSIIEVEDSLDPGLKPYYLEFSGASIDSIYQSIKHAESVIEKTASLGGVRASEARTMSGIALETEFQLLNAKLSETADNIELTEEQIWRIWSMYYNRPWSGVITYPGSFNIRDTSAKVNTLKTITEITTDPAILELVNQELINMLSDKLS